MRAIAWHWHGRIPAGRLTLLSGRPGASKSVVTCFIAAVTTRGGMWPAMEGFAKAGGVIFLAAEDDPADTICPRLAAAGADLSKVVLLDGKQAADPTDPEKVLKLSVNLQDIDQIAAALDQLPDCRLIVIDPIGSYMGGRVDSHRDTEVRAVLAPLAQLARDRNVAVLMVAHTNKAVNLFADDAVLGSRAFVGIARSVLHFTTDPDDKERKLLLPGKNNLAKEMPGLAYRVETDDTVIGHPPKVVWEEEPLEGVTADDYLGASAHGGQRGDGKRGRAPTGRSEAVELLLDVLSDGPQLVEVIEKEAKEARISWRTMERAKEEAGVTVKRQPGKFGDAKRRRWYWGIGEEWETPPIPDEADVDRQKGDRTSQDTELWRSTGENGQESTNEADFPVDRQVGEQSGGLRDGEHGGGVDRQNADGPRTPPEFPEGGGLRESQGETAEIAVDRHNSSVLGATPSKPRRKKQPKSAPPTGNPLTDPTAFGNLLTAAGWTWGDVVRWVEEQDGFVERDGGFDALTRPQVHKLVDHLNHIVTESGVQK